VVDKVVIPAAGLGTRFLPATKAQPKEMLPVVDTPAIQYVVEEALRAGLHNVLIVTGRGKRSIEDHFDRSFELERQLEERGKHDDLMRVRAIAQMGTIHYLRQREPLGLGHAVLMARAHVGEHPFVTMLADDIMAEESTLTRDMLALHEQTGATILALMEVDPSQIHLYGCAGISEGPDGAVRVTSVVEKPDPRIAPSNLAITGRYVFSQGIFDALARTRPGVNGEIQLTDAIGLLMESEPVLGIIFKGGRYDIGDKFEYLKATVELALARQDVGPSLRKALIEMLEER
jgi:UTP--glucose-1-phosphate uridylyltransferase